MIKIYQASLDDHEVWDGIINVSRTGTIFHTEDWLRILESSLGLKITRLIACDKGEIVAVIPITLNKWPKQWVISRRLPFTVVSPPILSENPYGGPCGLPRRFDAKIELLKYLLEKYPAGEINFSPNFEQSSQSSNKYNLNEITYSKETYIVDTTSDEDTMWRLCKGNMRTHVRKARKLGVKIVSSNNPLDMKDFYSLLYQTYSRSGFSPLPRAFYYNVFDILKKKNRARLFFALVDGKHVASEIVLMFKDRIYAWSGGSDRSFSSYSPNNLLSWEIARWARSKGFSYYDLCGAGIPSISKFKAGLGGRLHYYPSMKWKNSFYSSVSRMLNRIVHS